MASPSFEYVEKSVRRKTFGILTTIDPNGRPHSTGVLYGVGPPAAPFAIYVVTFEHYAKVRYIRANPLVTLAVTFPHRILSFVPASYVSFRGGATIVPITDSSGTWAFQQHRILQDTFTSVERGDRPVLIRIVPDPTVFCYGLGLPLAELRKNHIAGNYKVRIPTRDDK